MDEAFGTAVSREDIKVELMEKLDRAETDDVLRETAEQILELDPNDPCGKLALWRSFDLEERLERLEMLEDALDLQRARVLAMDRKPSLETDRAAQVYGALLLNLANCGLSLAWRNEEDPELRYVEQALEYARELLDFEENIEAKDVAYRCMLDLQMFNDILRAAGEEAEPTVMSEHARAIALLETGADKAEVDDAVIYAMSLAPDVLTFLLGIWEPPDDDAQLEEDEEITLMYADLLSVPWCVNDRRITEISVPAFLFAYLTDRLEDEKELNALEECYEQLGILEAVRGAKARVDALIAEDRELEETDGNALNETARLLEMISEAGQQEGA